MAGMTQGVLTIVTEILPERVDIVAGLLRKLGRVLDGDEPGDPLVDLRAVTSAHFARFVVLPPDADGKQALVFSSAYDGPLRFHLAELAMLGQDGLCEIYQHCVGFPVGARKAPATLVAYLREHEQRHGAMHVGYVGRTVSDIRREHALRGFIQQYVDRQNGSLRRERPRVLRDLIIREIRGSEYRWALEPREASITPFVVDGFFSNAAVVVPIGLVVGGLGVASFAAGGLLGFGLYAGVLGGAFLAGRELLRAHERSEPARADTDVTPRGLDHALDEDFGIRNQLSHIVDVKPGWFRRTLLKVVLRAVETRARFEFYRGDLGGIETIHCAHWMYLEGRVPRLLFFSNYDGSWERYLGDFIEEAGGGMTSVWSNTVEFPRARDLLDAGVTDERVFKAWTRDHQIPTPVWFAATPDISIRNVNDNSRLRDGLRGYMTDEDARQWLKLL